MNERAYYGHESQLFGVEEYRLTGGKGDGMRLLQVRNGKGLDFTVSADRCADISRLHFRGENCGFFSANGYVAPAYYDDKEAGWLKNFTAGFLTTCGLLAVGSPCTDEGVSSSACRCTAQLTIFLPSVYSGTWTTRRSGSRPSCATRRSLPKNSF